MKKKAPLSKLYNVIMAFSARIKGMVQGVGYRHSAVQEAGRLRINGWVRNSANGDVEVWAEGAPDKLAVFYKWLCRGPRFSRVDEVEKAEQNPKGYDDFNVEF